MWTMQHDMWRVQCDMWSVQCDIDGLRQFLLYAFQPTVTLSGNCLLNFSSMKTICYWLSKCHVG